MASIADVIGEILQAQSWNQHDLALALRVSDTAVSDWRAGKSKPKLEHVVKMAALLGRDHFQLATELGYIPGPEAKTPSDVIAPLARLLAPLSAEEQRRLLPAVEAAIRLLRSSRNGNR